MSHTQLLLLSILDNNAVTSFLSAAEVLYPFLCFSDPPPIPQWAKRKKSRTTTILFPALRKKLDNWPPRHHPPENVTYRPAGFVYSFVVRWGGTITSQFQVHRCQSVASSLSVLRPTQLARYIASHQGTVIGPAIIWIIKDDTTRTFDDTIVQ